jgi:hypothetical protein
MLPLHNDETIKRDDVQAAATSGFPPAYGTRRADTQRMKPKDVFLCQISLNHCGIFILN